MKKEEDIIKVQSYEIYKNQEIGRGQFGVVYQCKDLKNPQLKLCAKVVEEKLDDPKTIREIELMKMIMICAKGNKNIVGVEYVDLNVERIILILEKCESDLQSIIDKKRKEEQKYFKPSEALNILKQLVNGYKILYQNNIIHRDLKPANILVLNGIYKIADLGLARVFEGNTELTKVGTPKYVAPQLYLDNRFSNSADIFSLGIIIYELIFGGLPYVANTQLQIKKALRNLEKVPVTVNREWPEMTYEFADLIEQMLKFHEKDRVSWEELFKHPLIQEESNLVVNQSGLISNNLDSDEEEQEEEPVQVQKPVEKQNNVQQISPSIPNQAQQTFPVPISMTQKQQCFINPQTQPQFTTGKVFTAPFNPNSSIPTGNPPNPNIPNPNSMIQSAQPRPFINPPTQRLQTIPTMHILGQPIQFQQVKAVSDQLFQAGFVLDQTLESLEKFLNMQLTLKQEFFGIKLQLHCLSQCFYQHSSQMISQNQKNPNFQSFYSLQIVDSEIQKKIKYHQVITQEIEKYNLTSFYPVSAINPDFVSYIQKLNRITQVRGVFDYQNDRKYFQDYLSMLYFLERLKEVQQPSFTDLYNLISDIQKNKKIEQLVTDYLNKRLCN
ncbi:unnamed protein product [Paramecium pentaurelia]|uniref:Protein kinase domain-containing protein n=1 Tax=Paramecium pentaurelia TaxID=43138 RepID=A0A8S1XNG4_9CILI|nr:unnamed protein product [Paramecium pentaurelia]